MVQEALLKDLLMQTSAVKTSREAPFNIALQFFVTWSGQHAIRIIALVKHKSLEDDLAVDLDCFIINANAAQSCVAHRPIHTIASSIKQRDFQVVQMRVLRGP